MIFEVEIPHPPRILHPNARPGHWAQLYKAKKKYKQDCYYIGRTVDARIRDFSDGPINFHIVWHPKTKRLPDWDGCIASLKAGADGLADAWCIDDARFRISFEMSTPFKHGKVVIKVSQNEQSEK